jgi:hypothetical protein
MSRRALAGRPPIGYERAMSTNLINGAWWWPAF